LPKALASWDEKSVSGYKTNKARTTILLSVKLKLTRNKILLFSVKTYLKKYLQQIVELGPTSKKCVDKLRKISKLLFTQYVFFNERDLKAKYMKVNKFLSLTIYFLTSG